MGKFPISFVVVVSSKFWLQCVLNLSESCILQWVQCDKCECWQHQICALFNGRRNDGGQAEYTCPNCYVQEVKRGLRKPLPQSAVLGAKDLPRTVLSDHIEDRLFKRLKQEKQDRANQQKKSIDEVSETNGLFGLQPNLVTLPSQASLTELGVCLIRSHTYGKILFLPTGSHMSMTKKSVARSPFASQSVASILMT